MDKTSDKLHMAYYRRVGFPQRVAIPMSHVVGSETPVKVTILLHDDSVWAQPVALTPESVWQPLAPQRGPLCGPNSTGSLPQRKPSSRGGYEGGTGS